MGVVQLQEIGVQMRKVMIFSTKTCYRIVWDHPFLVGLFCSLAFLYRSFPFLFSVLLSVSPVLVCTAVLLGTLLSFGNPNIPEIEREEKTVHDIVPLRTRVLQDDTGVVERDDSFSVDRYTSKEMGLVDRSILGVDSFSDDVPLIENKSREIELESRVFRDDDSGSEQKIEKNLGDGEILEHEYSPIPNMDDENLESDNEKSVDSVDSKMVNIGSPMIDREILEHQYSAIPNLDDENLGFDINKSGGSFDSKMVDVDSPLKREEEEEEDDDDYGTSDSDSDRAESSSPDASLADIIPMLDELHPLLDEDVVRPINLSHDSFDAASEHSKSSESDQESDDGTENQEAGEEEKGDRKETSKDKQEQTRSAITWTEEDEKNLMDLGSSELERNHRLESLIARRRARKSVKNLIDLESSDLPFNIAPISTARKNPFDHPVDDYDHPELPPIPGSAPSVLLPRRNPFDLPYDSGEEKPDLKEDSFQQEFKTFHAKESFFRRHESFSVRPSLLAPSRHEKQDIRLRPYFVPEETDLDGTSYSRFQRQSSELSDSKVSSIPETESTCSAIDPEDKNLIKEETEDKNLSDEDPADENVIYKHSSEAEMGEVGEIEMKWESEENHHEVGPSVIREGYVAEALDLAATSNSESFERCSIRSSSSSLSEAGEKIFDESETQWQLDSGGRSGRFENVGSSEPLLGGTNIDITGTSMSENRYGEPIFDLSPTQSKEISSSSIASDLPVESIEKSTPISEEMLDSSPKSTMLVKNHEVSNLEPSEKGEVSFLGSDPVVVTDGVVSQDSLESKALFDTSVDENIHDRLGRVEHAEDKSLHSSFDTDIVYLQTMESVFESTEDRFESNDLSNDGQVESQTAAGNLIDLEPDGVHLSNLDANTDNDPLGEACEWPISPLYQSGSAEKSFTRSDEELALSDHKDHTEAQEPPLIVMESVEVTSRLNILGIKDLDNEAEPTTATPSSPTFALILHKDDEAKENIFYKVQNDSSESHEFFAEGIGFDENLQYMVDDKEIDEGILSELDAVGDFSVKESVSSLNEFGSGVNSTPGFLEGDSIYVHEQIFAVHSENLNSSMVNQVYENEEKTELGSEILTPEISLIDDKSAEEVSHGADCDSNTEEINPGMPLFEARSLEDLESIHEQSRLRSMETEVVLEQSQLPQEVQLIQDSNAEDMSPGLPVVEASSEKDFESGLSMLNQDSNTEDIEPGMPLVEASSLEDLESIYEEAKLNSVETDSVHGLPQEVQPEVDTDSGMPVLVARSIQDIDSAFGQMEGKENEKHDLLDPSRTDSALKQSDSKENEKHDLLDPPSAVNASGESESSNDVTLHEHSSLIGNGIRFETISAEDTDLDRILHDSIVGNADTTESLHLGAPSHECGTEKELEDDAEEPGSVEAAQNIEGGITSVEDCDVAENTKDDTKKLDFEVDKSEDSELAISAEKPDQEAPEGESSSTVDIKEESPKPGSSSSDSHKE